MTHVGWVGRERHAFGLRFLCYECSVKGWNTPGRYFAPIDEAPLLADEYDWADDEKSALAQVAS